MCVSHSTKRVTQRSTLSGQMFEYFTPSAFKGGGKGKIYHSFIKHGEIDSCFDHVKFDRRGERGLLIADEFVFDAMGKKRRARWKNIISELP